MKNWPEKRLRLVIIRLLEVKVIKLIKYLWICLNLKRNKSKNLTYIPNIRAVEKPISLIIVAKKTLNYLKQAFIKISIL